jgi:transaldolase/glucose-6-phosphate isomerase
MTNRLLALEAEGQAVWLDFLDRQFLVEGGFARLIEKDGVTGITSNPSIFEKAIVDGSAYDDDIAAYHSDREASAVAIYERLAVADLQTAADRLRPAYDRLDGADGFASIEVSPNLAYSTQGSVEEARRLWSEVDRPNLMVKIPGTEEGVPAVRTLTSMGINVNITLLFSIDMYRAVAEAYLAGLEERVERGEDVSRVSSVASFFVSRIDSRIDKEIDVRVSAGDAQSDALIRLRGKVAIANAKLAYQYYLEQIEGDRWQALAARGARPQRLLWASTGTKDPLYSDVLYVETLIGPDTINTMPLKTIEAFRDHGRISATLTSDVTGARHVLDEADRLGLDLTGVTRALVVDGIKSFSESADALLHAIEERRARVLADQAR